MELVNLMNSLTAAFTEYIAPTPFEHPKLRDWFFQNFDASGLFPLGVATLGSGPFNEDDFNNFLGGLGIEVYPTSPDLNVLVVGQQDWRDHLNDAIEARRGKEFRVYSQEMFLALLRTGYDPLEESYIARQFGEGHAALEYIQEWGFDWPNTRYVPSISAGGAVATSKLRDQSLLKIFGYTAGAKGRDSQKRRGALIRAFDAHLNEISDTVEFSLEWGEPRSGVRLKKMAEHITMNIYPRSAGRWREAESHWREDLQWLKATYYDGKHTFSWPSPIVD